MLKKECIAMILAGGQGSRLATLTTLLPKPAIPLILGISSQSRGKINY